LVSERLTIEWLAPVCGLIGVAIGAGISYYTQAKTQKRAWQREFLSKLLKRFTVICIPILKTSKRLWASRF
jgi:hypothetical protein